MGEGNIQDTFLIPLCKNKTKVAIFLKNGIKLTGVITAFDEYTLLMQEPNQQLVSKSAVATVMPLEVEPQWHNK